ncbi:uncharacterized protein PAC_05367 [Phialocephala subalpina]|uniref:Uncharacterized protein n=1 Tax=Phialocephala subalpina TaxID=576137 RepID=A0A1L7WRT6_9HELO|nr:uncharacterized protein PAC_05367 [Phialocephala subalpina]
MNAEVTIGSSASPLMVGWRAIRNEVAAMKESLQQKENVPRTSTIRSISSPLDSVMRYSASQQRENRPPMNESTTATGQVVHAISNASSAPLKDNPMWRKPGTRRMFGVQKDGLPPFSILTTFEKPFPMPLYCGSHPGDNWAEHLQAAFGVQLLCTYKSHGHGFVVYAEPFPEGEAKATTSEILDRCKEAHSFLEGWNWINTELWMEQKEGKSKRELNDAKLVWKGCDLQQFYGFWPEYKQTQCPVQIGSLSPGQHLVRSKRTPTRYEVHNEMFWEFPPERLLRLNSKGLPRFSVLTTFKKPLPGGLFRGSSWQEDWATQVQQFFGVRLMCTKSEKDGKRKVWVVYAEPLRKDQVNDPEVLDCCRLAKSFLEDWNRTNTHFYETEKKRRKSATDPWGGYNLKEFYDNWAGSQPTQAAIWKEASPPADTQLEPATSISCDHQINLIPSASYYDGGESVEREPNKPENEDLISFEDSHHTLYTQSKLANRVKMSRYGTSHEGMSWW